MDSHTKIAQQRCKFHLGHVVATPNALQRIPNGEMFDALCRHSLGDWEEVDMEDRAANERALIEGSRLLSVYRSRAGETFWILTEADRSATTILMPEDY
jgi:hypothetical protein